MLIDLTRQTSKTLAYLTEEISGLSIGAPLPSMDDIRATLGVSQLSVQRAYDVLEKRGRIVRKRRKGVFVSDHTQVGEIAIVVQPHLLGPAASPYFALVCNALSAMIHKCRPMLDVKLHIGKPVDSEREFADCLNLGSPDVLCRLRGVFSFHPLYELGKRLKDNGVPVLSFRMKCCEDDHIRVGFDESQAVRQFLQALIDGGCRSFGVLGMSSVDDVTQPHWLEPFMRAAAEAGLQTKPEWMPVTMNTSTIKASLGYDQFMQLWKLPQKPDGIVVTDDVACRGILQACLQLGVDLPNDVQLVSHSNKGVEFPYHKPLTRLEFDPQEQVKHALELIVDMLGNKTITEKHVLVPGKLISGDTTRSGLIRHGKEEGGLL